MNQHTGYKIKVGPESGISLQEAIGIINGFISVDSIDPQHRAYVVESSESRSVIDVESRADIPFGDAPLPLLNPVEIIGNGAIFWGSWNLGLLMMASNSVIRDVTMERFSTAIMVNAHGAAIENITISNCRFRKFTGCCIRTGSDLSDGCIKKVSIIGCTLEGSPEQEVDGISDWFGAPVGIMLLAGCGPDNAEVRNCSVEQILIQDCIFRGRHRNSINTIPAAFASNGTDEVIHYSHDCRIKDLMIKNCSFANAYDATINIMGSYMHNIGSLTENIEICDCYLEYNIWGIYFCATEPCQGTVDGAVVRNINVHHNELRLREGGSGEDSAALAIQCGRLDYADGAKANNGLIENVKFNDNLIWHTQHGIFLNAADSMVDGLDTEMIGNTIRNVEICRNQLHNVDDCFTFYGAQLEGRRIDVRIGIPPRTMTWLPLLDDHSVTTCTARDNMIQNVVCRGNYCTGYKFKYKIAGTKAGGHAYAENNCVAEDLVMEDNTFENGEGHILVENQVVYDWVQSHNCSVPKQYRR